MIRSLGPIPAEWTQGQLLARLDSDCYLQIFANDPDQFLVLKVGGQVDAPEAVMDRLDLADLLTNSASACYLFDYTDQSGRMVRLMFGRSNLQMLELSNQMRLAAAQGAQ